MSTEAGKQAEAEAAEYLSRLGLAILDRNWRNRWCEIDIVAEQDGVIHFVEVKYRANNQYGSGFDYISEEKQHRLQRAAEMWMMSHRRYGDYQIDAVSVVGQPGQATIEYLSNAVTG